MTVDDYWQDERVRKAASLLLFLFEGGATLALVWTMASASWASAAVSLAGVVLIAFHGPDRLERPLLSHVIGPAEAGHYDPIVR